MKVKATILSENSVYNLPGALAEHGLSVFLETDSGNYLLDTGRGKTVVNNSLALGLDLKTIKGIILSHHHLDHTGGLMSVLEVKKGTDIYAHPDLFKKSYNNSNGKERYLGIPFTREALESMGARFRLCSQFSEIQPGFYLTGEVPRVTDYEKGDEHLVVKTGNGYVIDSLLDDQSVVIETEKGLLVILGCCHSGIINTLNYIVDKMGQSHIYAVIGGTHLGPVSNDQRQKSIDALQDYDMERLGVCHCTGLETSVQLANKFGSRFFFCSVGTVVEA